jgi:hypothetical protein
VLAFPGSPSTLRVPRRSRLAFKPFDSFAAGASAQVRAAHVNCSQPCVAQLTMRQRSGIAERKTSSQSALGSEERTSWYFVGVPTSENWHPRLYFFNTSGAANELRLTYRNGAGVQIGGQEVIPIAAGLRYSYDVRLELMAHNPGALNKDGDLSLQVDARFPMVVTKILYWPFGGHRWVEGASTTGHSRGGTKVVFPGGNVGGGFNNYVQLMNIGDAPTNVWATLYRPPGSGGPSVFFLGSVPAKGMRQLDASSYPGLSGDFATKLETDGGRIIAESSTYFQFTGAPLLWRAGDAVEGVVYETAASQAPLQP